MKEDLTIYLIIVVDTCLRYYHLAYTKSEAVVEWLVFWSTGQARYAVIASGIYFMNKKILTPAAKGILLTWIGWLLLDFFQQLSDNNRGAQIWELVLFILISITIYARNGKNGKLV